VNDKEKIALAKGRLADVAPTLLDLMGLKKPEAMSGHSLVERVKAESAV
jgi:2,3-bisphosphoglycerate-independent phosphoglycerate mutase